MSAAGLRDERGDSLTVECVPFVIPTPDAEALAAASPGVLGMPTWQLASIAGAILAVLTIAAVILLRRRRAARSTTLSVSDEPALPSPMATLATSGAQALSLDLVPPDADLDHDAIRVRVIDLARRDPELAARIVRGWLSEGETVSTETPTPAAG